MDEISNKNAVGRLQEYCTKEGMPIPIYKVEKATGISPYTSFEISCTIDELRATGTNKSKKEAKQEAALKLLDAMKLGVPEAKRPKYSNCRDMTDLQVS